MKSLWILVSLVIVPLTACTAPILSSQTINHSNSQQSPQQPVVSNDLNKEKDTYFLIAAANPPEGGSLFPQEGQYKSGSGLTIRAYPNPGYAFSSWSENESDHEQFLDITMNSDKIVIARFVKIIPPLAEPPFLLSGLTISPSIAKVGEPVDISINVKNNRGSIGSYKVTLVERVPFSASDLMEYASEIVLNPEESKTVTFTITKDKPGIYVFHIGDKTGQYSIVDVHAPSE
jgi:hypothetical protein